MHMGTCFVEALINYARLQVPVNKTTTRQDSCSDKICPKCLCKTLATCKKLRT